MRSCVCVCVFDKGAATDKKCGEIERENQPKGRDMRERDPYEGVVEIIKKGEDGT